MNNPETIQKITDTTKAIPPGALRRIDSMNVVAPCRNPDFAFLFCHIAKDE